MLWYISETNKCHEDLPEKFLLCFTPISKEQATFAATVGTDPQKTGQLKFGTKLSDLFPISSKSGLNFRHIKCSVKSCCVVSAQTILLRPLFFALFFFFF